MRPGLGVDLAGAHLGLDVVVTDRLGRGQGRVDVVLRQRLQEGLTVGTGHGRGVLGPHPREAVGHELDPNAAGLRTLGVLLGLLQQTELVLDVVAVLVGDDVLLGQGSAVGAEVAGERVEEGRVDVDLAVRRAVEGPDLVGRRAAGRLGATVVEAHVGGRVVAAGLLGQDLLPVRLDGVLGADDAALHVVVGVGAGLALGEGVVAAGRLGLLRAGLGTHRAGIDVGAAAHVEQQHDDQTQQTEATARVDAGGVELGSLVKAHPCS